ncbi:hypothetical protein EHQ27_03180 [Leptospira wolffii]|uniref:Outer membrane protein beta-barrel domain-containing protein n=1 Tax=Leptospira wolffii TaxID=409998 RepID=A0A2M9ZDR1_9LEPT|nr:hypothetical protein [Leptospira wolffii]PJZ66549.1 hypothetical protein CH371_00060 [Leptospira wolffii]TGK61529.1 hypothetical protein EHQ32_01315 [Leptospira wolffii]TGK70073.1 hypothetical protein EHQ35_16730 [Leptospira wolffii]TGK76996.1 hypothetical protein EHQ27_03180 [Leptospira wolffii]TGL31152.1 hypothetical protein EHQ57_07080 [Leptospira wolffii]
MKRKKVFHIGLRVMFTYGLLSCLFSSGLFATDRESGNQNNSNWSVQYGFGFGAPTVQNPGIFGNPNAAIASTYLANSLFGGGSIDFATLALLSKTPEPPKVNSYGSRFYAEYAPGFIGFVFGMNADVLQFTFPQDNTLLFAALQQQASTGSIDSTLLSTLANPPAQKLGLNVTTLDFALNLHMNARKTVDPYFMLGLGVGGCDFNCYSGKVFGRLGVRFNLGGAYVFLEGEYNNYWIKYTDYQQTLQMNGPKATMGFGVYL